MLIKSIDIGLGGISYVKINMLYFPHSHDTAKSEEKVSNLLIKCRKKKMTRKKEEEKNERREKGREK